MTDHDIINAIVEHGAKAVYDAAYHHMAGNKSALAKIGLSAVTIADADKIGRVAFAHMSGEDRAADLTDIAIKSAKV